jgi:hypothetical protein
MLSRPTTEQILLDCCRELMTTVLPSLTDETAQVSVIMVETVLRNTAVRAAHEVAWMRDETADIEAYARAVAAQVPGTASLETALAALADTPRDSLHLNDVVETYCWRPPCPAAWPPWSSAARKSWTSVPVTKPRSWPAGPRPAANPSTAG